MRFIYLFVGLMSVSQPALAIDTAFIPHKALYEIKLTSARAGSQIMNISGQMYYEWKKGCDAWVSNHRFNMYYEYADIAPMRMTSNFTTYETFDGKSLNFASQRTRDSEVFEEIRGSANITEQGGEAIFTKPESLKYDLPSGTLFPIAHSMAVANALQEKNKFFNATIFDGSDEDGPVQVNAFIGDRITPDLKHRAAINPELVSDDIHEVQLAFFPSSSEETTADYEMSLAFFPNSVVGDTTIEYKDFTLTQKLIALEPTENICDSPANEGTKDKKHSFEN